MKMEQERERDGDDGKLSSGSANGRILRRILRPAPLFSPHLTHLRPVLQLHHIHLSKKQARLAWHSSLRCRGCRALSTISTSRQQHFTRPCVAQCLVVCTLAPSDPSLEAEPVNWVSAKIDCPLLEQRAYQQRFLGRAGYRSTHQRRVLLVGRFIPSSHMSCMNSAAFRISLESYQPAQCDGNEPGVMCTSTWKRKGTSCLVAGYLPPAAPTF